MEVISTIVWYSMILYIVYKILDHLIRIPRIGNYKDRYIFITGCDSGFGNAAAKRLDKLGCNVFAGCLTETGETELKKVSSKRLHTVPLDVTKSHSIRKAFEYVSSKLPPGKGLWGVLNNAGVLTAAGSPDWFSLDDYKRQCDVNLWGTIDVTLTFLPLVKKAKGRIANTTSIGGRTCFDKVLPYCISKCGVEMFSDGIRRALYVFGCNVSVIEPGAFLTNLSSGMEEIAAKSWKAAPREIQAGYGEEFARHVLESDFRSLKSSCSHDCGKVVDAYEHALLGRYPRARYVAGNDAKYFYLPVQWMPEWLGDWIYRRLSGAPLPKTVAQ